MDFVNTLGKETNEAPLGDDPRYSLHKSPSLVECKMDVRFCFPKVLLCLSVQVCVIGTLKPK